MRTLDGRLLADPNDQLPAIMSGSIDVLGVSDINENETAYNLLLERINSVPIISESIFTSSTPQIKPIQFADPDKTFMYVNEDGIVKVAAGSSFTLRMSAQQPPIFNIENGVPTMFSGQTNLEYSWTRDGVDIATTFDPNVPGSFISVQGDFNQELRFSNVTSNYNGTYQCTVSNDIGSVDSEQVTIEVVEPDTDDMFYKNLVENPYGKDDTNDWSSDDNEFIVSNLSNADFEELSNPWKNVFGYTADMFYPRPYHLNTFYIRNSNLDQDIRQEGYYFTRSPFKYIVKDGKSVVNATYTIDLTDIEEYIKGTVYGVSGVRAVLGCYIGNAISRYRLTILNALITKRSSIYTLIPGVLRLSLLDALIAGIPDKYEDLKVTIQEFDGETPLLSTDYSGQVVPGIVFNDPWTDILKEPTVGIQGSIPSAINVPQDTKETRILSAIKNNYLFPSQSFVPTYGQYVKFNKAVINKLNYKTTNIKISINFTTTNTILDSTTISHVDSPEADGQCFEFNPWDNICKPLHWPASNDDFVTKIIDSGWVTINGNAQYKIGNDLRVVDGDVSNSYQFITNESVVQGTSYRVFLNVRPYIGSLSYSVAFFEDTNLEVTVEMGSTTLTNKYKIGSRLNVLAKKFNESPNTDFSVYPGNPNNFTLPLMDLVGPNNIPFIELDPNTNTIKVNSTIANAKIKFKVTTFSKARWMRDGYQNGSVYLQRRLIENDEKLQIDDFNKKSLNITSNNAIQYASLSGIPRAMATAFNVVLFPIEDSRPQKADYFAKTILSPIVDPEATVFDLQYPQLTSGVGQFNPINEYMATLADYTAYFIGVDVKHRYNIPYNPANKNEDGLGYPQPSSRTTLTTYLLYDTTKPIANPLNFEDSGSWIPTSLAGTFPEFTPEITFLSGTIFEGNYGLNDYTVMDIIYDTQPTDLNDYNLQNVIANLQGGLQGYLGSVAFVPNTAYRVTFSKVYALNNMGINLELSGKDYGISRDYSNISPATPQLKKAINNDWLATSSIDPGSTFFQFPLFKNINNSNEYNGYPSQHIVYSDNYNSVVNQYNTIKSQIEDELESMPLTGIQLLLINQDTPAGQNIRRERLRMALVNLGLSLPANDAEFIRSNINTDENIKNLASSFSFTSDSDYEKSIYLEGSPKDTTSEARQSFDFIVSTIRSLSWNKFDQYEVVVDGFDVRNNQYVAFGRLIGRTNDRVEIKDIKSTGTFSTPYAIVVPSTKKVFYFLYRYNKNYYNEVMDQPVNIPGVIYQPAGTSGGSSFGYNPFNETGNRGYIIPYVK